MGTGDTVVVPRPPLDNVMALMPVKAKAIVAGKPMNVQEKIHAKAKVGSKCPMPCAGTSKTAHGNPCRRKHEAKEPVLTHSLLII
jgi:hypothetical protein